MADYKGKYYKVSGDVNRAPLRDHLMHGYEFRRDFYTAIRDLTGLWKDRVGECIDEQHGFLLLRFHDTPGGRPDEARIPLYLLDETDIPDYMIPDPDEEVERAIDEALGYYL